MKIIVVKRERHTKQMLDREDEMKKRLIDNRAERVRSGIILNC